jgi:hypothetical protein
MSAHSLGYRARDQPRERPALTVVWCGSAEQRDERVVNLTVLETSTTRLPVLAIV